MMKRILALRKEPIIAGSFLMTAGSFLVNIGNYFFNLLMGRLLTPNDYGMLASLISLSVIISIPSAIITTMATKFSADFFARKENLKITRLARKFTYYTALGSIVIFTLFVIFNPILQNFLKIYDSRLIIITGIMVAFGLVSSVNGGIFRGLLFFKLITLLNLLSVAIKLFLGWYLVNINYAVFGALLAIFISYILPWIISFWPIREFFIEKTKKTFNLRKKILSFGLPTLSVTMSSTLFLSSDLILVKHYFSGEEAGIYAATSIMGKAIFYALAPVSAVFFPIIAQRFAKGRRLAKEVILSLLLTTVPGIIAVSFYLLNSSFVVKLFFPKPAYLATTSIVGFYAIYMFFYSLAFLFINFFLAIEKAKLSYLALFISFLQITLIVLFHNSLLQVILASIFSIILLLTFFALYLGKISWSRIRKTILS